MFNNCGILEGKVGFPELVEEQLRNE